MRYHVSRRTSAAPGWLAVPSPSFTQGTAASYSLSAISSDPTSAPITYTSVGAALPTGVTINNTTKALDYSGGGSVATTSGIRLRATSSGGASDSALFSLTIAAPASSVDGQLGSYAAMNLTAYPVYAIDLSVQDIPRYLSNGSTYAYEPTGDVFGGPAARMNPGTGGDSLYNGFGQFGVLGSQGTFYDFSLTFEMQVGSLWAVNNSFDAVKLLILWAGAEPVRPMLYLNSASLSGIAPAGSCVLVPAQGTTKVWSASHPTPGSFAFFDGPGRADFYFGQSSTTYLGKRVLSPSEWVNVDVHCNSRQDMGFPNGIIRQRVTARDGVVLSDLTVPWNAEPKPFNQPFNNIDILGGYYNGASTTYATENCIRFGNRIRFAKNYGGPLGPRTGFVI